MGDLDRIEIRTNFTGPSPVLTTITLDDLAADDPSTALQTLRDVFTAPEKLRPRLRPAQITEKAAGHFAEIAHSLRNRGHDRPTWLANVHDELDDAVDACYGWTDADGDTILPRLLDLNLGRKAAGPWTSAD